MSVLRTSRDGCYELTSNYYGTFLSPTVDPLADVVITKEQMEGFELSDDIAPIPSELWSRWIQLCLEMVRRNNMDLEVSCRILRSEADPSIYRILIPVQQVTKVSVRVDSFDSAIDIETGATELQYPPTGWRPVGSSHSHNTMDAFFSGTDDQYELGDPGLHIVVGNFNLTDLSYDAVASVTANFRRFIVPDKAVIETNPHPDATYHPNVLGAIKLSGYVRPIEAKVSTYHADTMDFGYDPTWMMSDSYTSDSDQVKTEMIYVMEAIDEIIKVCKLKSLSVPDVLQKLAFDVEDMAESYRPMSHALEDPFYWNS